jgi:hypothetical protein
VVGLVGGRILVRVWRVGTVTSGGLNTSVC